MEKIHTHIHSTELYWAITRIKLGLVGKALVPQIRMT